MQGGCVDDEHAVLFRNRGINEFAVVTYRRTPEGNTRLDAAYLPPGGRVEDSEFCRCSHSIRSCGTVANIDDCSVGRARPCETIDDSMAVTTDCGGAEFLRRRVPLVDRAIPANNRHLPVW